MRILQFPTSSSKKNVLRPYLFKSVAYDYEKEIRFVLAARREILRDKGGILVNFGRKGKYSVNGILPRCA